MLKSELDERTRELLKRDKYAKVIIKKCPKCGLWYSEDLGHECEAGTSEVEAALGKWMYVKWIPVSERLPKDGEYVLVTGSSEFVFTAFYHPEYWTEGAGFRMKNPPRAWMPLPGPYREDEEDE